MRPRTPAAACALLLCLAAPLAAPARQGPAPPPAPPGPVTPPYLKLPATKTAKPGRYFCLKADTNCKSVRWVVPPGLEPLDPEIPVRDAPFAVVLIGEAGTYTVQAYGALGDAATDLATCVVTVGTPPPPPPPTPPTPTDPFTAAVQAAYGQETQADKASKAAFLAAVYAGAPAALYADGATAAALLAKLKAAVSAPGVGLTATDLPKVRRVVGDELNKALGTTPTAPVDKSLFAAECAKVAAALGGLK